MKRLFGWWSRTAEDKVAEARRQLEGGRPDLARASVAGVDHPDAVALAAQAGAALAALNLAEAVAAARRGDEPTAADHVALAEQLDPGGTADGFTEARRLLRELRAARSEVTARTKADRATRVVAVDPLGFAGRSFAEVGATDRVSAEPGPGEIAARAAAVLAGYPEALRARAVALGEVFGRAVLDLEEGRPEHALPALLTLPDSEAVVCWERARAADALGDAAGAARLVRAFTRLAGGHVQMGTRHSGVWLAELTAAAGDPAAALRTLRDVRATDPDAGSELFERLLAQAHD